MRDVPETFLAYAAGIVDGEGSIGISEYAPRYEPSNRRARRKSPQFRCSVTVAMTDPAVPVWLAEVFGGTAHTYEPRQPGQRPFTQWRLQNRRAAEFCETLLPYLRVKAAQAAVLIDFYADPRFVFKQRQGIPADEIEARREYVGRVKALNRGGQ